MAYAVRTVTANKGLGADGGMACGTLVPATTPALEYIELGWQPTRIELINYTGTNPDIYIWETGLASTNCIKMTGSTGVYTKGVTGPYPYAGSDALGTTVTVDGVTGQKVLAGFTIPAALQTNASDTWLWRAER